MAKSERYWRTPLGYDGIKPTAKKLGEVLPAVLTSVGEAYRDRPDLVLAAWPSVVGTTVASMTQAVSFQEGCLTVRVRNSTLYTLLCGRDRHKILKSLRDKFPATDINTILFRMG